MNVSYTGDYDGRQHRVPCIGLHDLKRKPMVSSNDGLCDDCRGDEIDLESIFPDIVDTAPETFVGDGSEPQEVVPLKDYFLDGLFWLVVICILAIIVHRAVVVWNMTGLGS